MQKIMMTLGALACALTLNAQAPKGPFEQGLTEPVVLRTDDVVFRQIDKHTWYGTGHLMANETVYLLEGSKRAMLIDCGTVMHDLDKLVKKLTRKPVSLYLTHAHPDHAGMAINYFDKVYMNPADTVGAAEFFPDYKGKMMFLKDGQIIDLGGRKVQVVFTPAHTPGSTTYIDLKNHVGFSGDSFGNGNLLLTGTFPTLHTTAQKMSDYMKTHGITKLWNGHYFGGNTESPKRVADEVTISDDVLSGKLSPQGKTIGNYAMLGLYHCIDTLGVKINYNKGALYSDGERLQGINTAYNFLKGCKDVYVASVSTNVPHITNNNAFNVYETDLYLMTKAGSQLAKDLKQNQNVVITAKKGGQTLTISCKLVEDLRKTSKEALLSNRPDLRGSLSDRDIIYKVKEVTAYIDNQEIKF